MPPFRRTVLVGIAVTAFFSGGVNIGLAASIILQRQMSFGDITAHPSGDKITIDASAGQNTPVSRTGYSVISNGISGEIRFDSSEVGKPVIIVYPAQLVLQCQSNGAKTMIVDNIDINSTQTFLIQAPVQDIHVGGRLTIKSGQYPCAYTGNMSITIVY